MNTTVRTIKLWNRKTTFKQQLSVFYGVTQKIVCNLILKVVFVFQSLMVIAVPSPSLSASSPISVLVSVHRPPPQHLLLPSALLHLLLPSASSLAISTPTPSPPPSIFSRHLHSYTFSTALRHLLYFHLLYGHLLQYYRAIDVFSHRANEVQSRLNIEQMT